MTAGGTTPTLAAGGIVLRTGAAGLEVLLIHRPRYDDWSLPKGHVEAAEAPIETAVREVREETGLECAPGVLAGTSEYLTSTGILKRVHYWAMSVTAGDFIPNSEVDEIRWLSPAEAVELASYDLDRDLIRTTLGTT